MLARQKEIDSTQAAMRRVLTARGIRVLGGINTVGNVIFVEGDAAAAENIRRIPGVARVVSDTLNFARLNRAMSLASFPDAAARVGIDKAGLGVGIAILDTGIDTSHPGFKDDALTPPAGYPIASSKANQALVTKKVIVVRSYEDIAGSATYGTDATDRNGHGTSSACAAGCVVHATPIGTISSAAPKAFLGSYKVLGDDGSGPTSVVLKGIDDAVKDGFDVLNLSLGNELTGDPESDLQVQALNIAADTGVVVVCAAGNEGPDDNSIDSPGIADKVIAVGSSSSDRSFNMDASTTALDPNRVSGFSSRGPSLASTVKPDMLSVGDNFYLAASTAIDPSIYYKITQGTSFASPSVAGAAAFVKGARPGLTSSQYRSLLVNNTTTSPVAVRYQGSGRLNILAPLDQPVTLNPVSLNFGRGGDASVTRDLTVTNIGLVPVKLTVSVVAVDGRLSPTILAAPTAALAPGAKGTITIGFSGTGLSGEYQGAISVANDANQLLAHAAYLYSVPSQTPASITVFRAPDTLATGSTAIFFVRIVDAGGNEIQPSNFDVAYVTGGGTVVGTAPVTGLTALYAVQIKAGATGNNVVSVTTGSVTRSLTFTVQ
jgi:subtilisin family serine protease